MSSILQRKFEGHQAAGLVLQPNAATMCVELCGLNAMPAALSSEQKLEHFLTYLARHRDLSANSQNQAVNAVLYFYKEVLRQPLQGVDALRAKRPARLRHAPTVAETQALLQTLLDRAG